MARIFFVVSAVLTSDILRSFKTPALPFKMFHSNKYSTGIFASLEFLQARLFPMKCVPLNASHCSDVTELMSAINFNDPPPFFFIFSAGWDSVRRSGKGRPDTVHVGKDGPWSTHGGLDRRPLVRVRGKNSAHAIRKEHHVCLQTVQS